ncbi:hypothetical protein [Spiroplasma endosymbiont of Andrena trimmerana]|uniref:hypothetical protein n=1 Tax=Spiroplasma endosymbiont of Andrena trimmerana TaxID=3066316 RepID=UPI001DA91F2F|nr:hypothetical protein [Spiroplasma ixodetis]MBP1526535.1 hypothetical protein [Spiroplasma ixodetis]MBP1527836.1 hypothetical protein [Spiroplasma ixodetis]
MPNPWKTETNGPTDLSKVAKWEINDVNETRERWKREKEEEKNNKNKTKRDLVWKNKFVLKII